MTLRFDAVVAPKFGMLYSLFMLGAHLQTQAGKTVDQALIEASTLAVLKYISMPTGVPGDVTPAGDPMRSLKLNVTECTLIDDQATLLRQYVTLALPQVRPVFIEEAVAIYHWVMGSTNGAGGPA